MRSPVEATTYRDPDSKQHLYAVKTKLVEQTYHGNPHRAGGVSPNPRKFREAHFCLFFAQTFHNLGQKTKSF
jgi:hypothetical protein